MRILVCMLTLVAMGTAATAASASERERRCMAEMIYHEARGESQDGQIAVAEVIMNRVETPGYPSTVCGVVTQKGQFSPMRKISDKLSLKRAEQIALLVMSGQTRDATHGATHFHTPGVKPSWSGRMDRTARIGSHLFYRPR